MRLSDSNEVYSMCALDALGVAPMLEQEIEIASRIRTQERRSPHGCGRPVKVEWRPESTVVVVGLAATDGDSYACCCPVLNFFASALNAERWLHEHPSVRGEVVSGPEAAEAGRAVFGDVLG